MKNYCSKCLGDTNHTTLFIKKVQNFSNEDYSWQKEYSVVECLGCDNISFRQEYWSEDCYRDPETGEWDTNISIYPLVLKYKDTIADIYLLPVKVGQVYIESVNALKSDCRLLAAAGFRAVIEAVCIDKGIKKRNIIDKIDNLNKSGFLSKNETDRLHAVRFLGNDSIHEIEMPSEKQLHSALIIIEHLLKSLYLIDKQISNNIDTMIEEYYEFEDLLSIKIGPLKKGEIINLRKVLGWKIIRRITPENLKRYEIQLQENIRSGHYPELLLGEITTELIEKKNVDVQNYSKVNDEGYDYGRIRRRFAK